MSMKAIFKLNDKFTFEITGDTVEDVFGQCAEVQGVFGDLTCTYNGVTDTDGNVEFVGRDVDGDMFYELRYKGPVKELRGCQKKFSLKKKPKGSMFPRFKNNDTGELLTPDIYKNNGWMKYNSETKETN